MAHLISTSCSISIPSRSNFCSKEQNIVGTKVSFASFGSQVSSFSLKKLIHRGERSQRVCTIHATTLPLTEEAKLNLALPLQISLMKDQRKNG